MNIFAELLAEHPFLTFLIGVAVIVALKSFGINQEYLDA